MTRPPVVLATRMLPGDALARLADGVELRVRDGRGSLAPAEIADVEGLLCMLTDRIDAALLANAPRLRAISSVSVGLDHVDLRAATRRGVPVGHTPGVLTQTTADLAFGLLLAVARRIPEAERFLRDARWTAERAWEPDLLLGRDVHGATLGIVGLGAIGSAVARRAAGFGMRVLAWTRTPREVPGVISCETLEELLRACDFVSLHVPLDDATRGLLGPAQLAAMRPGAVLINTARGGIVDEDALVQALRAGRLGGAGLDVYAHEPLPADHPLLGLENVVLLPHVGSASLATRVRMAELAVENLQAGLAGRPMPHCANREVYAASGSGAAPQRARKERGETT